MNSESVFLILKIQTGDSTPGKHLLFICHVCMPYGNIRDLMWTSQCYLLSRVHAHMEALEILCGHHGVICSFFSS